jgi:hypothetical protein
LSSFREAGGSALAFDLHRSSGPGNRHFRPQPLTHFVSGAQRRIRFSTHFRPVGTAHLSLRFFSLSFREEPSCAFASALVNKNVFAAALAK